MPENCDMPVLSLAGCFQVIAKLCRYTSGRLPMLHQRMWASSLAVIPQTLSAEGSLRNLRGDLEPNLEPNHLQPSSGSANGAKPTKPKENRITSRTIRCKYSATFTPQHKRNQGRFRRPKQTEVSCSCSYLLTSHLL